MRPTLRLRLRGTARRQLVAYGPALILCGLGLLGCIADPEDQRIRDDGGLEEPDAGSARDGTCIDRCRALYLCFEGICGIVAQDCPAECAAGLDLPPISCPAIHRALDENPEYGEVQLCADLGASGARPPPPPRDPCLANCAEVLRCVAELCETAPPGPGACQEVCGEGFVEPTSCPQVRREIVGFEAEVCADLAAL